MGRQHFKNHRNLFTALAVVLIPSLTLAIMFGASVLVIVYAPMFPTRSEITHVSVVSTSPLVLSVDVKAITSRDSTIYGAVVRGLDGHAVTWEGKTIMTVYDEGTGSNLNRSQIELPAGSTKLVTLEFRETLPSGNYTALLLGGMQYNHASVPFTIP